MKIAFVIPWFGKDIPGGAESACRNSACYLQRVGIHVEILTTCVKDFHSDWSHNHHKEGEYTEMNFKVRRFKVRQRNTTLFNSINRRLMETPVERLSVKDKTRSPLSREEENNFITEMINSPALYQFLEENSEQYDFILPIPYMFGTTYFASRIRPEKTLLIPCLHDESYAYMDIFKETAAKVKGLILNTSTEKALAKRLLGVEDKRLFLIGLGVETEFSSSPERFRKQYGINDPFILCVGRKDTTKNTDLLISYFERYKNANSESDLKLLLMGSGTIQIPEGLKGEVSVLGFVPAQDKYDAYSASLFLCNPSVNESFSFVLLESWIARTPTLVNGDCPVTREHSVSSNGGLYFTNFSEFTECVDFLIVNDEARRVMGERGREYVLTNYSWDGVVKKYQKLFERLNADRSDTC